MFVHYKQVQTQIKKSLFYIFSFNENKKNDITVNQSNGTFHISSINNTNELSASKYNFHGQLILEKK